MKAASTRGGGKEPESIPDRFARVHTSVDVMRFLTAAIGALLLVSGCGGGSTPETPPSAWVIVDETGTGDSGDRRTLLRSDDLGASWSVVTDALQAALGDTSPVLLSDVSFANKNTGWVVGGPNIWRTQDGGKTWDVQTIERDHPGAFFSLNTVLAFDELHVAVTGQEQLNVNFRPYVVIYQHWVFTADGGQTWHETPGVYGASLGDPSKCVAEGLCGYLDGAVTSDGGATWSVPPTFLPLASAYPFACTQDRLWALGLSTNIELDVTFPVLASSPDLGLTWEDRTFTVDDFFVPAPGMPSDEFSTRTLIGDVNFVNATDGWIVMTERSDASPTHHVLLRTRDGGASWSRLPDPSYPAPSAPDFFGSDGFNSLSFASPEIGALSGVYCFTLDAGSCVNPALAITTDGGDSFVGVDLRPYVDGEILSVHRVEFAH